MPYQFHTIEEIFDNYKSAVLEQDTARFIAMYHEDVHIFDCWDNWACKGTSEWEQSVKGWFAGLAEEGILLEVEFSNGAIEQSSTTAFANCDVTYTARNQAGEKVRGMANRFTFCFIQGVGGWKIRHEHSSLPISSENTSAIFGMK